MPESIVSNKEIQNILGITGNDTLINLYRDSAIETFKNLLGVVDILAHTITDEYVKVSNYRYLDLSDFPIDISQTITLKDYIKDNVTTVYNFELPQKNKRRLRILDENDKPTSIAYNTLYVSYTAGYTDKGTVTLDDNPTDEETILIYDSGELTTYIFKNTATQDEHIAIGLTKEDTAENIAEKISGSSIDEVITMPVSFQAVQGTFTDLTIINPTIPSTMKQAIAFMAGGTMNEKNSLGGVSSLKIDDKAITFRDNVNSDGVSEASLGSKIINDWINFYKKVNIYA